MAPQDTSVGLPSPRNVSVVSDRIAPATVNVLETRINGATLGNTWRITIWPVPGPERLGPLDERPRLHREGLRPDQPRGARSTR